MLFVKIEDDVSDVEVVVFPKLYQKNPTIWSEDAPLIIQGKISDRDAEIVGNIARVRVDADDDVGCVFEHFVLDGANRSDVDIRDNRLHGVYRRVVLIVIITHGVGVTNDIFSRFG